MKRENLDFIHLLNFYFSFVMHSSKTVWQSRTYKMYRTNAGKKICKKTALQLLYIMEHIVWPYCHSFSAHSLVEYSSLLACFNPCLALFLYFMQVHNFLESKFYKNFLSLVLFIQYVLS